MEKLNELAAAQTVLGKLISQLLENFKKEKLERRTVEITNNYQRKVTETWDKFCETHEQLEKCRQEDIEQEHPYFTKDYFSQVHSEYTELMSKINDRLKEARKTVTTQSAKVTEDVGQQPAEVLSTRSQQNKLINQLRATISALKRVISMINKESETTQPKAYYTQKLKSISQYWEKICTLHGQIMAELIDDTYNIEEYTEIEDRFQETAIKLQERLDEQPITTAATTRANVKLPKITLPRFDGNYTKWGQFKDLFTQLIHNTYMSGAERMYYLKANLNGEPSSLIKHLQATDENYAVAWKILLERYDNPRTIVTAILNELLSQPSLSIETSLGIKKLHDTTKECLLALENMGIQIKQWSPILLHLLTQKLDKESRRLYEQSLKSPRELQILDDLFTFLESRFQMLEVIQTKEIRKKSSTLTASTQIQMCDLCKGDHRIFKCPKFLYASVEKRLQFIKQLRLCSNCLRADHKIKDCSSRGCSTCGKRHNTLIHNSHNEKVKQLDFHSRRVTAHQRTGGPQGNSRHTGKDPAAPERQPGSVTRPAESATSDSLQTANVHPVSNTSLKASSASQILLATAVVQVLDTSGVPVNCRVLLDSGSQLHFICERIVQALGLPRRRISLPICGIGGLETSAKHETTITIRSRVNNFSTTINAVILKNISERQPSKLIRITNWNIPSAIQLADPTFHQPHAIDMLLGAELYLQLLQEGQIRLHNDLPILQNTHFGWILAGKVHDQVEIKNSCHIATQPSVSTLDKQLQKFWELEQHDSPSTYRSREELECEQHFQNNFHRSSSGRYVVKLPFREQSSTLGSSLQIASKRFYALERKLERNPDLRVQYCEFMQEYEALGHMVPIARELIPSNHYYMPHHCVVKTDSTSTKLRVVFDASAKTSSGKSLNDILMVGPTVQPDLFTIIARFRMYKYAMTADICKMYRQIEVHPNDRKFQLILWRDHKDKPLQTYQLQTVTYGTAAAPYLATRCLNQLALAESDTYPQAANVILGNTYVDDILTGADSMHSMLKLKEDLIQLLRGGGFELKKFCANNSEILRTIPEDSKEKMLLINEGEVTKTLGLIWQPKEDIFQFQTSEYESHKLTKRNVLSEVARIFDPLGLVGPVTVLGKLLVQDLWKDKYSWDEELPGEFKKRWMKFREGLSGLRDLKFPRHVILSKPADIQLHAFSDSSESAYGACCFIRSMNQDGEIRVRLLCAKSRLAPLKTTTLAKLELCAALLMAELVERVRQCMHLKFSRVVYHTDSTIVLSWISSPSYTWRTFVAHRVERIQQLSQLQQWRHIDGTQNPADIISRGMLPEALKHSTLWRKGPKFLSYPEEQWPKSSFKSPDHIPEAKSKVSSFPATEGKGFTYDDILAPVNHCNSFLKLQRIFAYCFRFLQNCKSPKNLRKVGELTIAELDMAINGIIRNVQRTSFHQEYLKLKKGDTLDTNHSLQHLTPFCDETTGMIKVGGRLKNSQLNQEAKHQILLPKNHKFSELLFSYLHRQHMHAAPQTLTAIARQRYWVVDARRLARQTVHRCLRCFKCKPKTVDQIMGDLPKERVRPARPFHTTGIDFCGPIMVHYKLRGKQPTKAYIAVFICFTTKAVHLELVSDLSTEAFLNALKRFIARRGLCATIFCDNATNFLGARNYLHELKEMFNSRELQSSLAQLCTQNHIEWKPIPPRSPHFGGLWEAAVKSAKNHLVRQIGNANLTYEELHTVIVQIEAILNSRPITPMSADPNDFEALTPGHFLTGSPLTAIAEPNVGDQNMDKLTRYRRIQYIQQTFWKRWSEEYLQELQTRNKWKSQKTNLGPGTLVLIKDANLPPLKWSLGRIMETFGGADNLTRVVNVKTSSGIIKRSIHNLCPLPDIQRCADEPSSSTMESTKEEQKQAYLVNVRPTQQQASDGEPSIKAISTISQHVAAEDNPPIKATSRMSQATEGEPPIKKRREKRPYHPLRGKFLPINPNWQNSTFMERFQTRPSTSEPTCSNHAAKTDTRKKGNGHSHVEKHIKSSAAVKLIMLTSLVLPILGQSMTDPVEITPFTNNPGIFFETLGHTHVINSHWNILAYYNLESYWSELIGIRKCINAIGNLCNTTTLRRNHCIDIYSQFQHQLAQIEEANEILHKQGGEDRVLIRRSPLDIVGNIANTLFGILDASYAKYIEEQIEKTRENEHYLMDLVRNQTSVLEATTNIMKRQGQLINHQFEAIHHHINSLTKYMDDIQQEQQTAQAFSSLSLLTNLVLQNYIRTQDSLIEVITDVHHNKISPLLITPMQLRKQLSLIKEHIPSSLTIPGKPNGLLLYNLMRVGARVTESYILFEIQLPLVLDEHFQLFRVIPVPIQQKDKLLLMHASTDYLIVNLARDRYYPLSQTELDKCRHLEEGHYMCSQNHPIFNLKANRSQCEMDLLNHRRPLPQNCKFQTSRQSNLWIQLNTPNSWLYSLNDETTFNVVCGNTVTQKSLKDSGILRLRPDCSIKQTSMTITGHGSYRTKLLSAFIPRINITELLIEYPNNKSTGTLNTPPELFFQPNQQEMEDLSNKIKDLKQATNLPRSVTHHDVHHYAINYLILTSLTIGVIWWIISRRHRTSTNRQPPPPVDLTPPIPAPRHRLINDEDFVLHSNPRGQDE